MKKLLIISIVFVLILALSACANPAPSGANQIASAATTLAAEQNPSNQAGQNQQQNTPGTAISREKTLEIALGQAGVNQTDIRDLDIELDREHGLTVWEVDFDHGALEYSYDVDAESGAITKVERERD